MTKSNTKVKLIMAIMESYSREDILKKISEILDVNFEEKPENNLISQPGLYEDENENNVLFTTSKVNENGNLAGFLIDKGEVEFYRKNGTSTYGGVNRPKIVRFLGDKFNFNKGELM